MYIGQQKNGLDNKLKVTKIRAKRNEREIIKKHTLVVCYRARGCCTKGQNETTIKDS